MPKMKRQAVGYALVGFIMAISYQNCDGGFYYDPNLQELSSLGGGGGGVGGEKFRITTYTPSGTVHPEGQAFEGGVEYKVVASGSSVESAVITWSLVKNSPAGNCVLKAGTGPETRFVLCTLGGTVSVQASAVYDDGETALLASERPTNLLVVDKCGKSTGSRIVFRIPAGTGSQPWNTTSTALTIYVGQTLRICNDDSVEHKINVAAAGTPCVAVPAANMKTGEFFDCVIPKVAPTSGVDTGTGYFQNFYDSIAGMGAPFYVRPVNGVALYADTSKTNNATSCAGCHNVFTNSTKRGTSAGAIRAAINANRGGMAAYNGIITDEELQAIAAALN